MKPKAVINPVVPALWSLWMIGAFGFYTLAGRLWLQVDGIVVSSRNIPPNRGPRYATEYTLRAPDGQQTIYTAGPTDSSLSRSMPVGTTLKKKRWHLAYERNGHPVDDFDLSFYSVVLGIAFGCLGWSISLWRTQALLRLPRYQDLVRQPSSIEHPRPDISCSITM
jgi:hypothetical protein